MSEQIVNALAKMKEIYIEEVSHNNLIQQRLDEEAKQIKKYKKPELDPVGEEDDDIDNDGDSDETDSYLLNRRKVRSDKINDEPEEDEDEKSKKKKKSVKENRYYSWRDTIDEDTLLELVNPEKENHVKEKKVNNYVGKEPVVSINPELKTESVLLDTEELDEDFIEESIDIVSDYLCEEDLTLEEIEDLIDEVGIEEFYEWVLQFGYESLLSEARAAKRARPGGKTVEQVKAEIDAREKAAAAKRAKKSTTSTQKKPPANRALVRDLVGSVAELARRERAAKEATKKGGIKAGLRSFFLKPEYHEQFQTWVDDLLQEGYDLSSYTWDELFEEYQELEEKAVSEQQQKLFGLALSVKRGQTPKEEVSKEVLKIVNTMSETEIRKYASTPHKGIPEKKEELAEKVIQFVRKSINS